jgi:hypothetical protein
VPDWPDPLPMSGQFLVEPEPELELEPDDELEEPDPVLLEPELGPEFPVVVAALATSAPPARSPDVSAPTARTLRKRICMASLALSSVCSAGPFGSVPHTLRSGSVGERTMTWAVARSRATDA